MLTQYKHNFGKLLALADKNIDYQSYIFWVMNKKGKLKHD